MAIDPNASNFDIDLQRALETLHGRSQAQAALRYLAGGSGQFGAPVAPDFSGQFTAPPGDVMNALSQIQQPRYYAGTGLSLGFNPQTAQLGLNGVAGPAPALPALPPGGGGGGALVPYTQSPPGTVGPLSSYTGPAAAASRTGTIIPEGLLGQAGNVATVAQAAAKRGFLQNLTGAGGLNASLPNPGGEGMLAKLLSPKIAAGLGEGETAGAMALGRSIGGRALPGLGTALALSQLEGFIPGAQGTLGGNIRSTLQGATLGGGAGYTVAGPVGIIPGAIAGTAIAGIKNITDILHPKANQQDKDFTTFNTALNAAGLSDAIAGPLRQQFSVAYQLAPTKEAKAAVLAGMGDQISGAIQQQQQLTSDQDAMLASQAMLQQFIAPVRDNIVGSAYAAKNNLQNILHTIPPEQRGGLLAQADQQIANANQLAGAYSQQMLAQPSLAAMQLQQQRLGQVGNTMYSQALQQQLGGGSGNLMSLLQGQGTP